MGKRSERTLEKYCYNSGQWFQMLLDINITMREALNVPSNNLFKLRWIGGVDVGQLATISSTLSAALCPRLQHKRPDARDVTRWVILSCGRKCLFIAVLAPFTSEINTLLILGNDTSFAPTKMYLKGRFSKRIFIYLWCGNYSCLTTRVQN